MTIEWNPWHGCHKKSEGCRHCYVYRRDARYNLDASIITKNKHFNLPIQKTRQGTYKILPKTLIYTCFTSDFLLEDAQEWLKEAWDIIRIRSDCRFLFLTKRIERFKQSMPPDWGDGWNHVSIGCTCENQLRADERLPIFLSLPIKHRYIICEPLLGPIDLSHYLSEAIQEVVVGGESGNEARVCDYEWVLSIRNQCIAHNVSFTFKQTGTYFKKEGITYHILRKFQHDQAKKAKINFQRKKKTQPNNAIQLQLEEILE